MKKTLLLLVMSGFLLNGMLAQIPATTDDGKRVILNEDGTWYYVDKGSAEVEPVSYECGDLIITEEDKMTGKWIYSKARDKVIVFDEEGKNGFSIFVYKKSRSIIFNMMVKGASNCIRKDSKILVLFRDGKRLELTNDGDANCNSNFDLYFDGAHGKTKELKMFSTKEVESFRIWTSKGYVEQDFSPEESKQLMHTVDCIREEGE